MFCMQSVKDIDGRGKLLAVPQSWKQLWQLSKERRNLQTKELIGLCNIAYYAEIQKIGEFFQTRFSRNSAGMLSIFCGWSWQTHQCWRWTISSKNQIWKQNWTDRWKTSFPRWRKFWLDFKVPSTCNFEISVWVNACRDAMQNCRQIAATNTVILIDDQVNEASACSGKHAARDVTLTAKGNFEQGHLPIPEGSWSIVPCSRDFPSHVQSVFPKRQSHGQGT